MENENVEVTPVVASEEKVDFTEAQQAKIESIIREVSGRVASNLRDENKRLQRELEAAKSATTPVTPDVARDLDLTRAELQALRAEQAQSKLDSQLRSAAGDLFLDTDLAIRVMRDSIKVGSDGKVTVIDADGNPALGSDFTPLSLAGLAQRVADQKKFLARGQVRPGAGSTPGGGTVRVSQDQQLRELFNDPKSQHELANRNMGEYRRLRAEAVRRGIVK